jgi:ADP-ribose pyrophosphatase YjhB (NUDIX family)
VVQLSDLTVDRTWARGARLAAQRAVADPYDPPVTNRIRVGVRAVVMDHASCILLVRFDLPDGSLWAAPGGGVEPGESLESAIRRELREETGMRDVALGPAIWTRTHLFALSPDFDGQTETFFLVRGARPTSQPTMSPEELRAEGVVETRWWTREELRSATDKRFAPSRLPELYEALLAEGPPTEPIDVGL